MSHVTWAVLSVRLMESMTPMYFSAEFQLQRGRQQRAGSARGVNVRRARAIQQRATERCVAAASKAANVVRARDLDALADDLVGRLGDEVGHGGLGSLL